MWGAVFPAFIAGVAYVYDVSTHRPFSVYEVPADRPSRTNTIGLEN